MKIFYYFGHPAQFHFQRNSIEILKKKGHQLFFYIKTKDVLEDLLIEAGYDYVNIIPEYRKSTFWGILKALIIRNFKLAREIRKYKPDLLIASDPSFSQLGYIFGIPSINCIDDDIDAIGYYSYITYPFTKIILTPNSVRIGGYVKKRIEYSGFMKLAYLHPKRFTPDINKIGNLCNENFFLIRLAKLSAHHDNGVEGINQKVLDVILEKLLIHGKVLISSENKLEEKYEQFRLKIPIADIHHYLYYAQALICDSQSMAGEAAMLGTPSIRVSSFVGKLSVLEELEHQYQLTFGVKPCEIEQLYKRLDKLLTIVNLKEEFQLRRDKMLNDKIDVAAFIAWFIENYPQSLSIMKTNPDYQYNFK